MSILGEIDKQKRSRGKFVDIQRDKGCVDSMTRVFEGVIPLGPLFFGLTGLSDSSFLFVLVNQSFEIISSLPNPLHNIFPSTMSQQQRYQSQNPNGMPERRVPPKAPEVIDYICGGTFLIQAAQPVLPLSKSVHNVLIAPLDCGAKTQMKVSETIRCKECGHRVLYKPRTHRSELLVTPGLSMSLRDAVVSQPSSSPSRLKWLDGVR